MENVYFQILFRPVVDRNGNPKYRKVKVLKVKNGKEENLTKGQLLSFVSKQFEKIKGKLNEEEKLLVEIPVDFLLSRTLIEEMELDKVNFLLDLPVSKFTKKHLFHAKQLWKDYKKGGLEISFYAQAYLKYKTSFPPSEVSFVCLHPEDGLKFHKNCFYEVDREEIFQKLLTVGDYFCGKIFGDYSVVAEINALSYLQATVSKALELTERDNINLGELEKVIKTDAQLAVSLLKYANSPLIAPPSPIKDVKHAVVYLGLNRLKQFLLIIMLNQLATMDKDFEKVALRLAAVGFLMEKKGKGLPFSGCQLFLSGIILEGAKLFNKPPELILETIEVPKTCPVPLEDRKILELYKSISEAEIEKTIVELKKLLTS